jgi:hypothetical protein
MAAASNFVRQFLYLWLLGTDFVVTELCAFLEGRYCSNSNWRGGGSLVAAGYYSITVFKATVTVTTLIPVVYMSCIRDCYCLLSRDIDLFI